MKGTKKIDTSETIKNGEELGQKLNTLTLDECKEFLRKNKFSLDEALKKYENFSKAFLLLDDEKVEILLDSLTHLNLLIYKECDAIRDAFDIFKIKHFGNNQDFFNVLRVIFHCGDKIWPVLENLQISFNERAQDHQHQTVEANALLKKQIALIVSLDKYVSEYKTTNKKENESLQNFLGESINTLLKIKDKEKFLDINDEVSIKYKKLQQLAKNTFNHRHIGWRVLADILQIITGAFIVMMPIRALTGKSVLFSQAKTARQEKIEEIANAIMSVEAG